jgi:cobalt-zinc-cadmium efflux system membrane fusion protein
MLARPRRIVAGLAAACLILIAGWAMTRVFSQQEPHSEVSSQSRRTNERYTPSQSEWATLTVEPVREQSFRAELATEGKLAVDEDHSTPVFSPYAGRVTRLLVKPGDRVEQGQPLFVIEAADTVQAQNDFIAALTAQNKAKAQLDLAELQDKRARDLFEGRAVPLKDYQQSQATLIAAQNDMKSAQTALEAARNRLRLLGFSDDAVQAFQDKGTINREITVPAPLAGTVVQRKVGPGQYVNSGASDPVYVIGDLSSVWLLAFVRETEAPAVELGQDMSFRVLALPDRVFNAKVDYVSAAIDPATRRLLVRASIANPGGVLKPEMFANVVVYVGSDHPAIGVPKQALIYEGNEVRVWVAREDKTIELRPIKIGLSSGDLVEVRSNLRPGERVVTRGSLFIDRAASGS